ncbi:MAG: NUDIX hydrolase, partial [Gammaproteobacteria bacterium]|nr:NUDIX hydrolase [Gammaproteobacteria bacterium]
DSKWITPKAAVKGASDGLYTIIFPTLLNVELLGQSHDVETAMSLARARDVAEILPWTEKREEGNFICIPPEAGYPYSEQRLPD